MSYLGFCAVIFVCMFRMVPQPRSTRRTYAPRTQSPRSRADDNRSFYICVSLMLAWGTFMLVLYLIGLAH